MLEILAPEVPEVQDFEDGRMAGWQEARALGKLTVAQLTANIS